MRYLKVWKDDSGIDNLTRDEAKDLLERSYPGADEGELNDWLSKPGRYNCRFSWLEIVED